MAINLTVFHETKIFESDSMNENEEIKNEENDEERHEVIRITSLKGNGSVWTKQYEGEMNWNQIIPVLLDKFPHIILSKQMLKQSPMEYLMNME
tara:strand:+ start:6463 stop:6744 length:282 start_codon:yes stop_codon:yes gene_type:complete